MYKQIAIPFFFLVVIAFTIFLIYRMWKPKAKRYSTKRAILSLIFLWYLCGVAAMTIVPIRESWTQNLDNHFSFIPIINTYHKYFYVHELNDSDGIRNYYGNLYGNILLFIPLGVFLPILYRKKFWNVVLLAALTSVLIELAQAFNMIFGYYRYVDIDDVLLNTFGAIIGYGIYRLLSPKDKKYKSATQEKVL
jgi:glycopeptide antibiotics resistance protein